MALSRVKCCLGYYDDMINPPPLALAFAHPVLRVAVEANTGAVGCGVYQACGLHISVRHASDDDGFGTYHSILEAAEGGQLDALMDSTKLSHLCGLDGHRMEDDRELQRDNAINPLDHSQACAMDCHAAVPRYTRRTAPEKDTLYRDTVQSCVAEQVLANAQRRRDAHKTRRDRGESDAEGLPLSMTAVAAGAATPAQLAAEVFSAAAALPQPGKDTARPSRPFFTEATPRAALPTFRRVIHAVHAPRMPYTVLAAMAWWLWRPSTLLPLEFIGSAFVGMVPAAHRGQTLATLFTACPNASACSGESGVAITSADLCTRHQQQQPSLISLRIRGFAHRRSCIYTEPTAELRAIAESAPHIQLLQLTGMASLRVDTFLESPLPLSFLFQLDVSNTCIPNLNFLRRVPPLSQGEVSAEAEAVREMESPFPFLRVLNISGCYHVTTLTPLTELPGLVVLVATRLDALSSIAPLRDCPMLQEVDLSGCNGLTSLAPLAEARALRSLRATHCQSLKALGTLLMNSATTGTLEYLNVSHCMHITSLFGVFEASDKEEADAQRRSMQLLHNNQQWDAGRWLAEPDLVAFEGGQEREAGRPATVSAESVVKVGPGAFSRTALRYLNIASTGVRLQTVENGIRIRENTTNTTAIRDGPGHVLAWIQALCPQLEQLTISDCAPRKWWRPSPATTSQTAATANRPPLDTCLEAAAARTGISLDGLQTIDLSPVREMPKLRKCVARGLRRVSLAPPCVSQQPLRLLGCELYVSGASWENASSRVEAAAMPPHTPLCWLDLDGSEVTLPVMLSPMPPRNKTQTEEGADATGMPARLCLDAAALRGQLQRDVCVQWLRRVARQCFILDIPAFTSFDPLEARQATQSWNTAKTAPSLEDTLHQIVLSEIWKPPCDTAAARHLTTQGSGCAAGSSSSGSGATLFISPQQMPLAGGGAWSSSQWDSTGSGMLSTASGPTLAAKQAPYTQPPQQNAPVSVRSPLAPYEASLRCLSITTHFLTLQEAMEHNNNNTCQPQKHPLEFGCVHDTPFVIAPQLRRLCLVEPANCPAYGREGAAVANTHTEPESPIEEDDDDVADITEVFKRPEDYAVCWSPTERQHVQAAEDALLARGGGGGGDSSAAGGSPRSDLLMASLEHVSPGDSYRAVDLIGKTRGVHAVVSRVGCEASAALVQSAPFVEELSLHSCIRSLRSLTPLFCLPPLWVGAEGGEKDEEESDNAEETGTEGEARVRALFETCARSCPTPHGVAEDALPKEDATSPPRGNPCASVHGITTPYVVFRCLRVLNVSFASRLTSLGPLVQCCPLLEKISLRSCTELRSLRGLHGARHLRFLDARGTKIRTVVELARRCPRLVWIDVSGCRQLTTLHGLCGAPHLRYLRACRTAALEKILDLDDNFYASVDAAAAATAKSDGPVSLPAPHFPELVELDVSESGMLESLATIGLAPRLERCNASNRKLVKLPIVRVQCPSLTLLHISSAFKVTSLSELAGARELRHVIATLTGVQSVAGLETCPQLSVLEVKTCKLLQSVACLALSPSLCVLAVDNSEVLDLGALDACDTLEYVNVTGCGFLSASRPRGKQALAQTDDEFAAFKEAAMATVQRLRERGVVVQEDDHS